MSRPTNPQVAFLIGVLSEAKVNTKKADGKIDNRVTGVSRFTIRNLPAKIKANEIKAVEHQLKSTYGKRLIGFGLEANLDKDLNCAMQLWVKVKQ